MSKESLTPQQELFLDTLFSLSKIDFPTKTERLKESARVAGYSENTNVFMILKGLKSEIVNKVEEYLALHAPEAAISLIELLEKPDGRTGKQTLEVVKDILDRVGVVKKNQVEIQSDAPTSIIIIPTKNTD